MWEYDRLNRVIIVIITYYWTAGWLQLLQEGAEEVATQTVRAAASQYSHAAPPKAISRPFGYQAHRFLQIRQG